MRFSRRGFTLIELIIVIVIIGVLASIAAPMMQGMKAKAIISEAVTTLGTIRTALQEYHISYNDYPPGIPTNLGYLIPSFNDLWMPGLKVNDLTGVYFGKECYAEYNSGGLALIWCQVDASPSSAPKATEVTSIEDAPGGFLYMDLHTGKFSQKNLSRTGYSIETRI